MGIVTANAAPRELPMKILLDCSPKKISEYTSRYRYEFGQFVTPLTQYKRHKDIPYGLDNGCFSEFKPSVWRKQLKRAKADRPLFVAVPDVVGCAVRTLDLFDHFLSDLEGLPACLVLQDGIGNHRIPWGNLSAVFIGGSDKFKCSTEAVNAAKVARFLGKHIHVGRVNSYERAAFWAHLADTCDGSGVSMYDRQLENVLRGIKGDEAQSEMFK